MGIWYRRLQVSWGTFRSVFVASKDPARNPASPSPITSKISQFSYEWNLGFRGSSSRFLYLGGRRFYKSPTSMPSPSKKWFEKPRNLWLALLFGSGISVYLTNIYLSNLETVPYTNRTRLVLVAIETEKRLGKAAFKNSKQKHWEGKILPADHPESVKANSVLKNMIEPLQNGLLLETDLGFGSHDQLSVETERVKVSWKKVMAQPETRHLKQDLHWEVIVVDKPTPVPRFPLPDGKIIITTGFLRHFDTDDEIAAFFGHQIGHFVSRHFAEWLTRALWKMALKRLLSYFVNHDVVKSMTFLMNWPCTVEMEVDAVYIGLMLMASAGYDPRTAVSSYEKLPNLPHTRDIRLCNMRAMLDPQGRAMKEAMNVYRARTSSRV